MTSVPGSIFTKSFADSDTILTDKHMDSASQLSVPQKTGHATKLYRPYRPKIYGYAVSSRWLKKYGVKNGLCGQKDSLIVWGSKVIQALRRELRLHKVYSVPSKINGRGDRAFAFPVAPLDLPGDSSELITQERIAHVRQGLGKPEGEEPAWYYVLD